VAFAFAPVPPHAALLGATRLTDTEQLIHLAAAAFPAVRRFADDPRRAGYVAVAGDRCWWRAGHDDPPELEAAIWARAGPHRGAPSVIALSLASFAVPVWRYSNGGTSHQTRTNNTARMTPNSGCHRRATIAARTGASRLAWEGCTT
jgi:hypothetical protein